MIPEEALLVVLSLLEKHGIPYMISGSFASNLHGLPRVTQDADVVIDPTIVNLHAFLDSLGADFYFSREEAIEAFQSKRIFNLIHLETGFKVDLIIRKSRPFSRIEFERKGKGRFLGTTRWFASPEDVILVKLEWAKLGESERQFTDALNVARIQGEKLDRVYLETWAGELEIGDYLRRLFEALEF
jgi:hypothetical protein